MTAEEFKNLAEGKLESSMPECLLAALSCITRDEAYEVFAWFNQVNMIRAMSEIKLMMAFIVCEDDFKKRKKSLQSIANPLDTRTPKAKIKDVPN